MAISVRHVAFLAVTVCIAPVTVADAETIDDIVRALNARSDGLQTLQVEWQGEGFYSKRTSLAHGEDRDFPSSGKVLVEASGRKRVELTGRMWTRESPDSSKQGMHSTTLIVANDGTGEKTMFTRGAGGFPSLSSGSEREHSRFRQLRFLPLRLAYWPLDPDIGVCNPELADPHVEETTLDGRRHLIARFGKEQIWLDPERGLLPVRHDEQTSGTRRGSTEIEYSQVAGRWQPAAWKITKYDGEVVIHSYVEKVTSLTWNPPVTDVMFTLEPAPESWEFDHKTKRDYVVQKDGSKRLVRPGEYTGTNFSAMVRNDYYWWRIGSLAILFVVIGLATMVLVRARRK